MEGGKRMEFNKENISTIASFLYVIFAPIIVKYFNFNIDQSTFTGVIGLIIIFISAKYPNTFKFLGNTPVSCEAQTEEDIIESNDYEIGDDGGC